MPGGDLANARAWCVELSRVLSHQDIKRDGRPYLRRYFAAGWAPHVRRRVKAAIFLHHFVSSDGADQVHSHPWLWSASLILVGGYREIRCSRDGTQTTRVYQPGDVNLLTADDRHRVELLENDCWTLFMAGPYVKPWEFAPSC
jgi:hypothetical protein